MTGAGEPERGETASGESQRAEIGGRGSDGAVTHAGKRAANAGEPAEPTPPEHAPERRTLRIGLTGPIGCGKSHVAGYLRAVGAVTVDADEVARGATAPGQPAHDAVLRHFGPSVAGPDGTLDRAALARLVFADATRLRELEAIVHPEVRPRILAAIDAAQRAQAPAVVIEAIKLVEGGLAELCDEVWLVTCDARAQRERLGMRGTDPADAERRIAAQAGLAERLLPAATRVIDTSGSMAESEAATLAAFREALASG